MRNAITTIIIGIVIAIGLYSAIKKEIRAEASATELIVSGKVKTLAEQIKKNDEENIWRMYEATSPSSCKKENMAVDLENFTIGGVSLLSDNREIMGKFPCWTEFYENGTGSDQIVIVQYKEHGIDFFGDATRIRDGFRGRIDPNVFKMSEDRIITKFGPKIAEHPERHVRLYANKGRCLGLGSPDEKMKSVSFILAFKSSCDEIKKSWEEDSKLMKKIQADTDERLKAAIPN